jgi:hypothetical protein
MHGKKNLESKYHTHHIQGHYFGRTVAYSSGSQALALLRTFSGNCHPGFLPSENSTTLPPSSAPRFFEQTRARVCAVRFGITLKKAKTE